VTLDAEVSLLNVNEIVDLPSIRRRPRGEALLATETEELCNLHVDVAM
jgi:hypothetical protein